jgi:hypothetical protein
MTVIGLDFDNTIVTYDAVVHQAALQKRLVAPGTEASKRAVRDRIRKLPDGEVEWQRIQALVYGPLMPEARLIDGVEAFIRECRASGLPVYIVSHKTAYAGYDETRTDLREAALRWMEARRFFHAEGLGFRRDHVFFESTREEKIARIEALGCTLFVDDLEEVFLEPSFPADVRKILFAPEQPDAELAGATVLGSWRAIHDHVFGQHS